MKIAAGVAAALIMSVGTAHAMDVQTACASTIDAYATAWDSHEGDRFAALFTDDATLDLGFGPAKGRAAIAELFAKRNPGATTRHLMTNVVVTPRGPGAAEGVSYLLLFSGPAAAGVKPAEVEGFALMGEYHDRFAISGAGCRFADRRLVTVFRRARPAPPAATRAMTPSAPRP